MLTAASPGKNRTVRAGRAGAVRDKDTINFLMAYGGGIRARRFEKK